LPVFFRMIRGESLTLGLLSRAPSLVHRPDIAT
jgi:hypothetical protein